MILHEITPNIGRWRIRGRIRWGSYLDTLDRLVELEPAIVFPGHHRPIEDAPSRAAEIREHHAVRLDEHQHALRAGAATGIRGLRRVWGDSLGFHERRFALVEAIAHLERLERLGRAEASETRPLDGCLF